jgi:hypothetical protein
VRKRYPPGEIALAGWCSPEWSIWRAMRRRCYEKNRKTYHRYGGRGITVCDRWLGEFGYENFIADMGKRPSPLHQIDRIDNDGNYEPENCRWVTSKQNNRNRKSNHRVDWNGLNLTVSEWAEKTGISKVTILDRLKRGWTIERALSTPGHLYHRKSA